MKKIMVELYLPANGRSFDVRLPQDICVWQATEMISSMIASLNTEAYMPKEEAVLCDGTTGNIYSGNVMISELQLKPGSRVMLI